MFKNLKMFKTSFKANFNDCGATLISPLSPIFSLSPSPKDDKVIPMLLCSFIWNKGALSGLTEHYHPDCSCHVASRHNSASAAHASQLLVKLLNPNDFWTQLSAILHMWNNNNNNIIIIMLLEEIKIKIKKAPGILLLIPMSIIGRDQDQKKRSKCVYFIYKGQ